MAFNFQRGRNREKEREDFCLKIFERGVKDFWRKEKIESGGVLKNFKDKIVIWFVLAEYIAMASC